MKRLFPILLFLALMGCSGAPSQTAPAATITAALPAPTRTGGAPASTTMPALTATLPLPTAAPSATNTPIPTPATLLSVVKEENGWVTYRNGVIGYEISAPKGYVIKGRTPEVGKHVLGPAVPDEEINRLLSKYYGDTLYVWFWGNDPTSQSQVPYIGIYAYDIIVNNLGGNAGPGGMGDYQLTLRQETLQIDWHSYPVQFTVMSRENQPVGELAVLRLEKDGVEFMFGYIPSKDDPEAYQTYRKQVWPEIRKMIETYKKLPEKTTPGNDPVVHASSLNDASPQAIAQALFAQYLAAYQANPIDPQMQLSDYRIDQVEIPAKWQACAALNKAEFIAAITYSVKPERWPPERWTEDGYQTFDQWITRKQAAVAVFRSGQDYTMQILDHPTCPGF